MSEHKERIPLDRLSISDDGVAHHCGTPFSGIAFREENGILRYQQAYLNGLEFGAGATWWEDGSPRSTMNCYNGASHGIKREWSRTGELLVEEMREFGILILRKGRADFGEMTEQFRLRRSDAGFRALSAMRKMYPEEVLNLNLIAPD